MLAKEFKKLLKEKEVKQLVYQYCHNKIYLTNKQLNEVIRIKNESEKN